MMRQTVVVLILCGFALVLLPFAVAGQTLNKGVLLNPMGLVLDGLAYLEYEHEILPQAHFLARGDLIRWGEKEEEIEGYTDVYRTEYTESGIGPGLGLGMRYYFLPAKSPFTPYGSFGTEVVFVSWEWEETSYRQDGSVYETYDGDGSTVALAFHFGTGVDIRMQNFVLQGGILAGSLLLNEERSSGEELSGTGFFFSPVVALGYRF